ncbi:MAG: DUF1573 domain-containing protein [Flavobacterium sp.]
MIKKIFTVAAVASLALTACNKENAALRIDDAAARKAEMEHANSGKLAEIKFESTEHDFGDIKAGDKVEHVYKFTNTGTADLVISNAKPSCGCTVPSFTQTPVKPGESGEIKAVFDSTGKSGAQNKTIDVTMNTLDGTVKLTFKANILPVASGITAPATPLNK